MKIIEPSIEILTPINREEILKHIELCGRVCYKSENRITEDSAAKFVKAIIARVHEAVIEHQSISVRIICDRGVSHELVRHRLASYCQESTRYCNYDKDGEVTFIKPNFWILDDEGKNNVRWATWEMAMHDAEKNYFKLIEYGATPQEARSVLPNSLKTEVIMTANLREWRHFFKLRCAPAAHPQMRQVAWMIYEEFRTQLPEIFEGCV